jgi:diguanylate cyclase (GGDEF)-like protein/PAS domain S-box-containing protein
MLGYGVGELAGAPAHQVYGCEAEHEKVSIAANLVLASGGIWRSRISQVCKDGQRIWVDVSGSPLQMARGESLWCFNDITQRVQAESDLIESELHLKAIVQNEPECIKIVDAQGLLLQMNPAGLAMIEADATEQVIGKPVIDVIAPEYRIAFSDMHKRVLAGETVTMEFEVLGLKGGRRWLETHAVPLLEHGQTVHLAVSRDITERRLMQEQVRHLAFHDALTNLPNRRLLLDRMAQTMAASKRSGRYGALMFIDLDNFKPLNDVHGHEMGDLLLIEVAERMRRCVREIDTVARFGGDEFVIMLSELNADRGQSIEQVRLIAEKIRLSVAEPYELQGKQADSPQAMARHHCTASIGVALFFGHQNSIGEILGWADQAMYAAKEGGRNRVHLHQIDSLTIA